jgi:hypothetical protein
MKINTLLAFTSLFGLLWFTGCQSGKEPGSSSHAVVQINGHSLEEIQKTTAAVFGEAAFSLDSTSPELMNFERPGTRGDAAKYGGWTGTGVTMRVKVAFRELAGGAYQLQADAYSQQNSTDPFFRTENRVMLLNRKPYQQLLDEVAKRLK